MNTYSRDYYIKNSDRIKANQKTYRELHTGSRCHREHHNGGMLYDNG
jgi:hypothetical protein